MKKKVQTGSLGKYAAHEIFLNVSHLEKGVYQLKIVDENNIVKNTHFIKK